jgi:endoglucanase
MIERPHANRRRFLQGLSAMAGIAAGTRTVGAQAPVRPDQPPVGVSLAGAEFGTSKGFSNANPGPFGKAYTFPTEKTIAYFAQHGIPLLRVPFLWERVQPRLGEALDADHLKRLREVTAHARKHGAKVVLDVHNYGRYRLVHDGQPRSVIIDEVVDGKTLVSREQFADLWTRLSDAFQADAGVEAYGLMNEPHDMKGSDWKAISQAAVTAIRRGGDGKRIWVGGDSWSSAERFVKANGPKAWIDDPKHAITYEAHCYFDRDASGTYKQSYTDEAKSDPKIDTRGARRIQPFADWCHANSVPGVIGEYGVPDDPGWSRVLDGFLAATNAAGLSTCWWAAGEWWGGYPLSLQPRDNFKTPAPQMKTLRKR